MFIVRDILSILEFAAYFVEERDMDHDYYYYEGPP